MMTSPTFTDVEVQFSSNFMVAGLGQFLLSDVVQVTQNTFFRVLTGLSTGNEFV